MASNSSTCSDSFKLKFERNKFEYEEMKRRLLETEEKLQNLKKLEEEVQSVASEATDKISSVSNHQAGPYRPRGRLDEFESISSALGTLPGSYTGFANYNVHSSTPAKMQQVAVKHKTGRDGFESDSSTDSTKENRASGKYERKLLLQNQRLLLEVERLVGELHESKVQNASLLKEADDSRKIPDLEERIEELHSESQAQDKALRAAEKTIEEGAKRNVELQKKLDECKSQINDFQEELEELKETKKAIENQRDEAVQNLIDMQEAWDNYQLRTREKIRKLEEREDELRDNVTSVTQERDDLLDQLADIQASLSSQEAQINRLLQDVEMEDAKKHRAEEENQKLLEQLDQLTAQINDFEKVTKRTDSIRQEKLLLEQELNGHRIVAQDVAELLALFQKKQDKNVQNFSENGRSRRKNGTDIAMDDSDLDSLMAQQNKNNNGFEEEAASSSTSMNINNNGFGCEGASMIGELRNLFCNMDSEIQRLRCDLKQRDSDDRTYQNLREELKVLMEKVEGGMQRNQDLECMVINLEDDKKALEMKLGDACTALEERDREIQCLDTRLQERNRQVICLQEDVNDKAQRICCLEKELRELREQLETCLNVCNLKQDMEQACRKIKEQEEIMACKEASIADLEMKVACLQKEMKAAQVKYEKKISCLCEQVHELQRQIQVNLEEIENLRQKHCNCAKIQDDLRRTVRAREESIKCLQQELEDLKTQSEEKEALQCKLLECCQEKLNKSNEQVQQLECALMMCKNEVSKHLQTMEEIKAHFENEIAQRDTCIKQLNECLRKYKEDLDCKTEEVCSLEQSIMSLKCKIEQMFNSLKESENNNNCLIEKLKLCENQNLQERACCMKETEELDRKLAQCCSNLGCIQEDNNKLKKCVQEKVSQIDCLTSEKNSVCRDLHACKQKACELQEQINKMEADNTELCEQLHLKMECIKDLEQALVNKDSDLKTCCRAVEELNRKIESMTMESNDCNNKQQECIQKLNCCFDELQCKTRMLLDCEECLKQCKLEIQDKDNDIQALNCQLEDCRCKLQERIVKVEELENAIEVLHKETEKRMKRVDEQLRRYECELSDKCRQVTDLDECLSVCQQNLTAKTNECCQLEQRNNRLCNDLQTLECKLKEHEEQRACLVKQLNDAKAENAEVTQELRVTREELQKQHQELLDTKQSLSCCNRECEKLNRSLEEMKICLEESNGQVQQLCEEKNCLMSKVAHLQCRLESEACQATQQYSDLKCCMEKEIENLKACIQELEENNSMLMQKYNCTQRQLQQVEKCCHQKLDSLNRELEDLLQRLADRDEEIISGKDLISMKEQEIMRLKLRLCSCDMNCSNCNLVDVDAMVEDGRVQYQQDELRPSHKQVVKKSSLSKMSRHNWNTHGGDGEEEPSRLAPEFIADTGGQAGQGSNRSETDRPQKLSRLQDKPSEEKQTEEDVESSSTRNSLGVSEVQEKLRSNQRLQMEIEKQLKSLEDNMPDDIHPTVEY